MKYRKSGNEIVKEVLKEKFSLDCIDVPLGNARMPDFFIEKNNSRITVCEVKDMRDDVNDGSWTQEIIDGLESYEKNINDFPAGKVAKQIRKANEQLKLYDLSKILIFINYWSAHISDLQEAFDGGLLYDDGTFIKDPRAKVLKERIGEVKNKIDLYIWIDKGSVGKEDKIYFKYCSSAGKNLRQNYFKFL